MKIKFFLIALMLACVIQVLAQDPTAVRYGNLITEAALKENLSILASDALEGRETGKRGQKMAAAFIRAHFEELGLTGPVNGSYFQPVTLYTSVPGNIYVKAAGKQFNNFQEVVYYGTAESGGEVTVPLVFVGKGRKEDFDQLEVAGKAVLIHLSEVDQFSVPVALARERKAKMVLLYTDYSEAYQEILDQLKSYMDGGMLSLTKPGAGSTGGGGVFFVSPEAAPELMKTDKQKLSKAVAADASPKLLKKIRPATVTYHTSMAVTTLKTDNVLGFLEGTDKKDDVIIITAHYDHIGKLQSGEGDLINNGADDDGSGTVTVLELAKAFAAARKDGKGPRRSILFMTVTGEEKGLLGSDFYTQNPVFPLARTMVNLNVDMVGRRDAQHKDSPPYVYVIGSDKLSATLHRVSEEVNNKYNKLVFDYTYNDQNHPDQLYYRSDHWNFAKNNIPVIFYFDGIHEDYHKPSDEVDKIEFDLLQKRAQTVFYTAWELANREERIKPDQKVK